MEVRTSRGKAAAVAVACVAVGAGFASLAQSAGAAWVGVGVCALGVLASGKRVFVPTTMFRLGDRELEIVGGVRGRPTVPWDQTQAVEIHRRRLRGSVVTLTIADGTGGARRLEFSDTWLDTRGADVAHEIADRSGAPVVDS
ncbi:MAG: hypothetical protein JO086_16310 [Acidimicrobiia bacterium]|nr:hypothetical protein [Acidimicrobiia bacterium]